MSSNVIGEAKVRVGADTGGFDGQVRKGVGSSMRKVAAFAGAAFVAGGLARTIAGQIGAAGALQKSLRETTGLLGQTGVAAERTFGSFKAQVAALSREVGIAQEEISSGLYEAIGAGVPKGNAIEFLRVSSQAATAGVTDLATTVDGLTTVINAYGLKASDAQAVSDSLFQTVNAGKVTFEELAGSLFNVAPTAASANVSLQTVGAALATLTAGGTPATVATTQLRYAIQSLVSPSIRAEKLITPVFKKAGYESGQAALKGLGLQKSLQLVRDAAGGSSVKLTRMIGSAEALNAVLTLTGKGSDLFRDQLVAQEKAAGVTAKSLAQIEKSAGRSFERAKVGAENFGLALGDAAAPAVARLADDLTAGLNRISASAGFKSGVEGIADGIAGAITDPQTIATLQSFGTTAVQVFGAVRASAAATAPALRTVASILGSIAASPAGPPILLTAIAYSTLGRVVSSVTPKLLAVRAAQQASAAAAAAAAAQSVTAVGLVGASTTRAAATAVPAFGRVGIAARGLGTGLLAMAGGPVGASILGVSALAAGAFLLSQRESDAERHAREFSGALRDQATAANTATDALNRQRDALSGIINAKVGVDQAAAAVAPARAEVARITAAPAADFGGEAKKKDALRVATNALAQAEDNLNRARRASGQAGAQALSQARQAQAAASTNIEKARAAVAATGSLSVAQVKAALTTNLGRQNAVNYAKALDLQVRASTAATTGLTQSAATSRKAAAAVDTTTASGKKLAAQLRTEARESTNTARASRVKAVASANASIEVNRAIVSSKSATAAERKAASERIKVAESLVAQIRAAGKKAGAASAEGVAAGAKSKKGEVQAAGRATGEAAATGAGEAAPAASTAGEGIGTSIGLGVVLGIDSQVDAARAAGVRLGAAGAAGAREGAQTKSPSKLTTQTGRDLAAGLVAGVHSEQGKTTASIADLVRQAGAVGVRNARVQGGSIARAIANGFRVSGGGIKATITTTISAALRESIVAAQGNLTGFASQLADLGSRAIDAAAPQFAGRTAGLDARQSALDAASAVEQERQLRNAVSLAEAGKDQATKRYAALQAAQARRSPEATARMTPLQRERERQRLEDARLAAEDPAREQRAALDSFLVQADRDRLTAEQTTAQAATEARKAALDQQLADLTANLNASRIGLADFRAQIPAILAGNGVDIGSVGGSLGSAYVDAFNLALRQLGAQGGAVAKSPGLPKGFVPGIERPSQVAIAEAITTRNVLRSTLATELERVRRSQGAQRAALQATFTQESSAGGTRIVASERRVLAARAAEHAESIKAIKALGRSIANAPPTTLIESLVVAAPGSDPSVIGTAVAREITKAAARRAKR